MNKKKQYMTPMQVVLEMDMEDQVMLPASFQNGTEETPGGDFNSIGTDMSWKSNLWDEDEE